MVCTSVYQHSPLMYLSTMTDAQPSEFVIRENVSSGLTRAVWGVADCTRWYHEGVMPEGQVSWASRFKAPHWKNQVVGAGEDWVHQDYSHGVAFLLTCPFKWTKAWLPTRMCACAASFSFLYSSMRFPWQLYQLLSFATNQKLRTAELLWEEPFKGNTASDCAILCYGVHCKAFWSTTGLAKLRGPFQHFLQPFEETPIYLHHHISVSPSFCFDWVFFIRLHSFSSFYC